MRIRVLDLTYEAEGVVSMRVGSPDGQRIPPWSPGSHVDLVLPNGLERQYSIVDASPGGDWLRVAVLKDQGSRGGSEYIHLFLRPGQVIDLKGPRNHFRLVEADEYVFLAGGIGITPILSMIEAVDSRDRRWQLHYGGRQLASMAFASRVLGYGSKVVLWPEDTAGPIPLADVIPQGRPGLHIYACGPAGMLRAVEDLTLAKGHDGEMVHFERFKPTSRVVGEDTPFRVHASRSGVSIDVAAEQTTLVALLEAGINVPYSCKNGVCGTCEVSVMAGTPDHRDDVLSTSERAAGTRMMVCVSRAATPEITLEI